MSAFKTLVSLALLVSTHLAFVQASVYVTNPVQSTVCHAGQSCQVEWVDDGQSPLLSDIGECTVGLYNGEMLLAQSLTSVNVADTHSFSFTPNPSAGNNGGYYLVFTSTSGSYQGWSGTFSLDGMTGSSGSGSSTSGSAFTSGSSTFSGSSTVVGSSSFGGSSIGFTTTVGSSTSAANSTSTGGLSTGSVITSTVIASSFTSSSATTSTSLTSTSTLSMPSSVSTGTSSHSSSATSATPSSTPSSAAIRAGTSTSLAGGLVLALAGAFVF